MSPPLTPEVQDVTTRTLHGSKYYRLL